MEKPESIETIFDNDGKTIDRFTVIFELDSDSEIFFHPCLSFSIDPEHPQGFSQWGHYVFDNKPLGKEINWEELPEHLQKHIIMRIQPEGKEE